MAGWKKLLNTSDGLSALSDIDTAGVSQNEVLIYNGTSWEAAPSGTTFNFDWLNVNWDCAGPDGNSDVLDTTLSGLTPTSASTVLIGDPGNHITSTTVSVSFANSVSGQFTGGNISTQVGAGAMTDSGTDLAYTSDGASGTIGVSMAYPTVSTDQPWTTTNKLKVEFQYDDGDGDVSYSNILTYSFGNHAFLGLDSSATDLDSDDIQALSTYNPLWTGSATAASNIPTQSVTSSSNKYIHFWMPARITDTPTFKGGDASNSLQTETWEQLSDDVPMTNANNFVEKYKGWRSENYINSTTGTWYVAVTF